MIPGGQNPGHPEVRNRWVLRGLGGFVRDSLMPLRLKSFAGPFFQSTHMTGSVGVRAEPMESVIECDR